MAETEVGPELKLPWEYEKPWASEYLLNYKPVLKALGGLKTGNRKSDLKEIENQIKKTNAANSKLRYWTTAKNKSKKMDNIDTFKKLKYLATGNIVEEKNKQMKQTTLFKNKFLTELVVPGQQQQSNLNFREMLGGDNNNKRIVRSFESPNLGAEVLGSGIHTSDIATVTAPLAIDLALALLTRGRSKVVSNARRRLMNAEIRKQRSNIRAYSKKSAADFGSSKMLRNQQAANKLGEKIEKAIQKRYNDDILQKRAAEISSMSDNDAIKAAIDLNKNISPTNPSRMFKPSWRHSVPMDLVKRYVVPIGSAVTIAGLGSIGSMDRQTELLTKTSDWKNSILDDVGQSAITAIEYLLLSGALRHKLNRSRFRKQSNIRAQSGTGNSNIRVVVPSGLEPGRQPLPPGIAGPNLPGLYRFNHPSNWTNTIIPVSRLSNDLLYKTKLPSIVGKSPKFKSNPDSNIGRYHPEYGAEAWMKGGIERKEIEDIVKKSAKNAIVGSLTTNPGVNVISNVLPVGERISSMKNKLPFITGRKSGALLAGAIAALEGVKFGLNMGSGQGGVFELPYQQPGGGNVRIGTWADTERLNPQFATARKANLLDQRTYQTGNPDKVDIVAGKNADLVNRILGFITSGGKSKYLRGDKHYTIDVNKRASNAVVPPSNRKIDPKELENIVSIWDKYGDE